MIMPYLRDIINDHKATKTQSEAWKIQISMRINFISSKDAGETHTIYIWSDNQNILWGNETSELLKNFLNLF